MNYLYSLAMARWDCLASGYCPLHSDRVVDKSNPNNSALGRINKMLQRPSKMDMVHLLMGNDWQTNSDTEPDRMMLIATSLCCHYCFHRVNNHRQKLGRTGRSCLMMGLELKVKLANHQHDSMMNWVVVHLGQ